MAEKNYIYVAWWGTYSSGGSEGTDPYIEYVPDGNDTEIAKYLDDSVLSESWENWQSDHWRGVKFRRLTPEETKTHVEKMLMGDIIRFLDRVMDADDGTITTMLQGMVQIDGFPRSGMRRVRDLFDTALKGFENGNVS